MKILYMVVAACILSVALIVYVSQASADYRLTMIDMDSEIEFGSETFIAYSDCRKRGLSNLDLLSAYTNRVGFICPHIQ